MKREAANAILNTKRKTSSPVSQHTMDQQWSPCCYTFLTIIPSYHSKLPSVGALAAENIAVAFFLHLFRIALPASLSTLHCIVPPSSRSLLHHFHPLRLLQLSHFLHLFPPFQSWSCSSGSQLPIWPFHQPVRGGHDEGVSCPGRPGGPPYGPGKEGLILIPL